VGRFGSADNDARRVAWYRAQADDCHERARTAVAELRQARPWDANGARSQSRLSEAGRFDADPRRGDHELFGSDGVRRVRKQYGEWSVLFSH
jgi:hypothetical protein